MKKILLLSLLFVSFFVNAQTLYWVGGSGYWNDINHWSTVSGGYPSGVVPNPNTHVIFDDNSGALSSIIHATESVNIASVDVFTENGTIELIGSPSLTFKLNAYANLNPNFKFHFNGKVILSPTQNDASFKFSHTIFSNEVIVNSNHTIELGVFNSNSGITFNGAMNLKNSFIITNTINSTNGLINLNHSTIFIRDGLILGNSGITGVSNTSNKLIAPQVGLTSQQIADLSNNNGFDFKTPIPAACTPTLLGTTNPTCKGLCNGTATISLPGCIPNFVLQWVNTNSTGEVSCTNLPPAELAYASTIYTVNTLCKCSDQYVLLITENNGSGAQYAVAVGVNDPISTILSFSTTPPICNGLCNGQIRLNITTGALPLSVTWIPPVGPPVTHPGIFSKDTLKNACVGTYTVNATNANGCINTYTVALTQPSLLLANGSSSSVTCNGLCNGSATVAPTGGTSPYTYTWSAGSSINTATNSGLCPGVITGTVVDSHTCTTTYSANIIQPSATTVTVSKTNMSCGGVCNGSATVTATGGTPAFTYSLNGVATSSVISGLCAGTYTVDAADAQGCSKTVTFTITSPPALTAIPTQTNVTCNGLCNGAINLHPSGGTPVNSYAWSPAGANSPTLSGVCAGVYTYTITDALLCTNVGTITLIQPTTTTLTVAQTNISCFGLSNGSATVTSSGGTPGYSYTWTPSPPLGQGTATISGLSVGTYSAAVKDFNGCPSNISVTISQPTNITPNITTVAPSCNGLCNGSITSAPTGGIGAYTFTLQSNTTTITTNPPYNGLCAKNYTLLIGNSGCLITNTISLTQPNPITLSLNATPINCFGQCNSTISSVVNGGTPAYTYAWSNGSTSPSLVNQCAGIMSATVTDAGGCIASASVNVTSPSSITVSVSATNLSCFGSCNAIATATVSGGTPNYTYLWAASGGTNSIAPNLCAGMYTLTVKDNLLCTQTQTVNIISPTVLTLTASNGTLNCSGVCNGTVGVVASGGTPGYSYNWNSTPAQLTPTASALCVGNYFVSVTDSKGCLVSTGASVTQPPALTAAISGVKPSCNVCIGAATVTPSGGTPAYTYTWTNSSNVVVSNSQVATNLCTGFYTVTVGDAQGCSTTQTVQILQTVIIVLTTNGNTLQCNGGCSGIANANPSGGVAPYSYLWSPTGPPVQSAPTATALCAGSYTVVVTDALGCSNTGTVAFINPPATTLTVTKTNETCFGQCNGTASVSATGGTGAHTYQWLPGGQTTANITGLCGGIYTVNVSDANGCIMSQTVQINSAVNLTATFTAVNPTTCGGTNGSIFAIISGGSPGYTYTWTPGASTVNPIVNIGAGSYNLSIKDAAGCTQTVTATLSNPTGPTVTVTSSSITCFGLCNGTGTATALGFAPLSYSWSAGGTPTNSVVSGLCAGVAVVSVTDGNVCVTNATVNIAQPTQLTASGVVTNVTCNGVCTVSINLTPSGGTSPYTYTWSPAGGSVQDPINLCIGNYTGTTTDNNGCAITNTFIIAQPSSLTLAFNKKDVACNGGCTGGVKALVAGGTAPYTYSWTPVGVFPGSVLDTITNLCTGTYTVKAMDASGCSITGTVTIGQPTVLTSSVTSTNITCNGLCNGTSSLTLSGGTLPYNYNWNTTPATITPSVGGLCVGNYLGIGTDANGCSVSNTIIISQPSAITVSIVGTNPKCNAACDGSFVTTVNGGMPGYQYQWIPVASPTGTLQNPTGLCAGNYTLIVTDNNSCTKQVITSLTNPSALLANVSFTNPLCSGLCNGIATANPVGGTGSYTYSWSTTQTSPTINSLCSGPYTVVVTDANLCTNTKTITLIPATAISVNPAVSPATCGVSNGSIDVSATTGTAPFTYNWPAIPSTNTVVAGLPAGVYTVIVTDASSCTATISIPLSNSNGPTWATITTTNVTCHGLCNGSATVSNAIGGTAPYILSWVNPLSPSSTVSALCPGTYTAQIKDALGCILFRDTTIAEPQLITDNATLVSSACFGNCNGSISLNPSGGNGGYTYSWTPTGVITGTVTNLCPGPITTTITDSKGCTFIGNYNLPSLTTITSSAFATNNNCFGDCNGSILVNNVAGGLPPYTYLWNDPLGQLNQTATALCNGNYSVTITDANGCTGTNSSPIISNSQIAVNPTITQPSCNVCNGIATLAPTGGAGTYTFVWSNTQITNPATNLCAGVYGVQVTDNLGCITHTNVLVNSSNAITETIVKQDESCAAACNGSVNITAVGGTAPITYNWIHNNSPLQTQTGLCAGIYFCNMTDANGCSRTASVVIGSAATLSITSQVNQSSCVASTGSITVNVSGGTGAGTYTYAWLPAGNTPTVSNLSPGIYTLTVTDGNLCSNTQTYTVNSINGPVITSTVVNANCSGACTGSIAISISAGSPTYTTSWSTGGSGLSITSLCAGNYSVAVTDNLGCKAVQGYSINGTNPILFSSPNVNNPKCFNDCNGSLTAIPSGGSLPFTYSWTPSPASVPTASNLCAGPQTITIVDAQGCIASQTYTLVNPVSLGLTASVLNPTCSAIPTGSIGINAFGGMPIITYSWSNGAITPTLSNLLVGNYTVTLTDGNGCKKDTAIVLTSTLIVTAIAGNDTVFCQSGTLSLNGTNSIGGITYDWVQLPGNMLVANNISTTVNPAIGTSTYVLIATNGACISTDTIKVKSNTPPIVDAGPFVNIPLYTTSPIGGTPTSPTGVTYTWTPNIGTLDNYNTTNPTASNTVTMIYTVTVTDANGCSSSDTVTVFIYPEIKIPNGFSPNADGKNDVWQIDNIFQFPDNVVEVYNRWGELLFMSKGYAVPFDGKYNGKNLPVGTYYYIIDLHHPSAPKAYTGPLTIFR
jgi:gliding motility-associated-like protein